MPQLPSGLQLAISRDALFDHGGNWFECPAGHFWYWGPSEEMGEPPFSLEAEIMQKAEHAPAPRNREEAKRFLRVLEMRDDGKYGWRGEWLSGFPRYTELSNSDFAAWNAWLDRPETARFLDETVAECERLAEVSRRATGYAVLTDVSEPDDSGWRGGNLRVPDSKLRRIAEMARRPQPPARGALFDIEMPKVSEEFQRCWQAAGQHIQKQAQGPLHSWLRAHLKPPFLEHLSFRLGNQLFFVRIEDPDGRLEVPGSRDGLLAVSVGCQGHPCIMPMRYFNDGWHPEVGGWGLVDSRTGDPIDPIALVSDESIEMTDWELQDFAVQIVRDRLKEEGRELMSWQSNPSVDPSIWFIGDDGPEWVVVRSVRYPKLEAVFLGNWTQTAESCSRLGKTGNFASVSVANADDAFDPSGTIPAEPLWRGHALTARFNGLVRIPIADSN